MAISCADDEHCVTTCDSGWWAGFIRVTTDGGKTWRNTLIDKMTPYPDYHDFRRIKSIAHPTRDLIIGIADTGVGYRSTDGGYTWKEFRLPVDRGLGFEIKMFDETYGYISGPPRWLFKTTNGGESWNQVLLPDSVKGVYVEKLSIVHPDTIILSMVWTNKGVILRSTDGGVTWDYNDAPVLYWVPNMFFIDFQHGYSVGYKRTGEGDRALDLYTYTTDGGRTWAPVESKWRDPAGGLRDIRFLDRLNGIAVGGQGKILRTYDGGKTWEQQPVPLDTHSICNIIAMEFPSPRTAYATITNFQVLRWIPTASSTPAISTEAARAISITPSIIGNEEPTISALLPRSGHLHLEVVDATGAVVWVKDFGVVAEKEVRYSLQQQLPSGVFFVRAILDGTIIGNERLMVMK